MEPALETHPRARWWAVTLVSLWMIVGYAICGLVGPAAWHSLQHGHRYSELGALLSIGSHSWGWCALGDRIFDEPTAEDIWFRRERLACYDEMGGAIGTEVRRLACADALDSAEGDLVPLYRMPPSYPEIAERRGLEGRVLVEFGFDALGRVVDVDLVAQEGEVFARPALEAVSEWTYCVREGFDAESAARIRIAIPFRLASI